MIQKLKLVAATLSLMAFMLVPSWASAQCTEHTTNCNGQAAAGQTSDAGSTLGNGCANQSEKDCLSNNKFLADVRTVVNIISGLVGVIVVGMVILGGIQYSIARDNAGEIGAAQKRIANALIALVIYMLVFGFLQWLIPGGLFA